MDPQDNRKNQERGAELGKLAGRFVKNAGPRTKRFIDESRPKVEKALQDARPRVEKAIEDYRPKVEQAGRDAVRYAQEHENEIKGFALRGARMRLGPLGMAIDALGIGGQPQPADQENRTCAKCSTANAVAARFCTECGEQLPSGSPGSV